MMMGWCIHPPSSSTGRYRVPGTRAPGTYKIVSTRCPARKYRVTGTGYFITGVPVSIHYYLCRAWSTVSKQMLRKYKLKNNKTKCYCSRGFAGGQCGEGLEVCGGGKEITCAVREAPEAHCQGTLHTCRCLRSRRHETGGCDPGGCCAMPACCVLVAAVALQGVDGFLLFLATEIQKSVTFRYCQINPTEFGRKIIIQNSYRIR